MLELSEVDRIAGKAASAALKDDRVAKVFSRPTADSDGKEALNVTIVIRRGAADQVNGDSALEAMVTIGHGLEAAGEDRPPIIYFVTEEELEAGDDPES
jgi:hypothetical protein